MSFIRELSRRRVFRGAGVYCVIAFLIAALIAPNVAPTLRGYLYTLLALGLPFAALFSWLFRVRPGEFALEIHHQGEPPATPFGRALDIGVIAGVVITVVGVAVLIATGVGEGGDPGAEKAARSRLFMPDP